MSSLQDTSFSFIGCGVMAEAIIAGLLRRDLVAPAQIIGSHPRAGRREELENKYGIRIVEGNGQAVRLGHDRTGTNSIVVFAVKPQRLGTVLSELKDRMQPEQLVLSIVAGAKIETIVGELSHP